MVTKKRKSPRYEPLEALTVDELQLLIEHPYENPGWVVDGEREIAVRLIERGLLESDPSATAGTRLIVRCTEAGTIQARPLSAAYVQHLRNEIEAAWQDEDENEAAVYRLERLLWMRVIAENALGGSRVAEIALETATFIINA